MYFTRMVLFVACSLLCIYSFVIAVWCIMLDVHDNLARWIALSIICGLIAYFLDALKGNE